MYELITGLIIYRIPQDSILYSLADIIRKLEDADISKNDAINGLYSQINRLLILSTKYGFDDNLWHNYLAYILAVTENPFSLVCEKEGIREGSVNKFAESDFRIFKKLFEYDFSEMEKELGINCFSIITQYHSVKKNSRSYNKDVSKRVRKLSLDISGARDEHEIFTIVTQFYKVYGVGTFAFNKAFRIAPSEDDFEIVPITNTEEVVLTDLSGYEIQKRKLIENTKCFVEGRKANNVLLYGDSGTGKSTSVKAILNEYYSQGLRVIEIYKHQFEYLTSVISMIKNRNYKFIIYMDDLSFEEFEIEYKYLKAVIEGGLEIKPDNVLIYATSNRRHLIRETWSDRSDLSKDELHRSDTMQEKLSLVARFGISIHFSAPSQKEYHEIVRFLAKQYPQITLSDDELIKKATAWEMSHGGLSGRTASQFITSLAGLKPS